MTDRSNKELYAHLQKFGKWLNLVYYGGPAIILLLAMYLLGVGPEWWTPVILIYATVALGNIICFGFQALNMQILEIYNHCGKKIDK